MNDVLVPDWIKKIKAEEEIQKAQAEVDAQRQLVAAMTIKAEGPEFWRQLLRELAINAEGLSEIGLRGQVSKFEARNSEQSCRVDVALCSTVPRMTYTDFFYREGSAVVRCHTQEGVASQLPLCVRPEGGIGILSDDSIDPLSPEKSAEILMKRMVNLIRPLR